MTFPKPTIFIKIHGMTLSHPVNKTINFCFRIPFEHSFRGVGFDSSESTLCND